MNINDVMGVPDVPSKEYPRIILERQTQLEDRYWAIEMRTKKVFGVNERNGQIMIKDFLWRITEEIGEALEAGTNGEGVDKIAEELADGLHFVAGLCVILDKRGCFHAGWDNPQAVGSVRRVVESLGKLGNTLKMKPWKQTEVLTDENQFNHLLVEVVRNYLDLFSQAVAQDTDITPDYYRRRIFNLYWKKSEVNLFRIASKY